MPRSLRSPDEQIGLLASCLLSADGFLFGAGAGFSADSGLAVYRDVADIPIYHRLGLTYGSLCNTSWLLRNPDIFYGFWGMCFDNYMDTTPHEGYQVVRRLLSRFSGPRHAFVLTSNVDSHFLKTGVPDEQVYEFHGTCMDWQCSRPCTERAVYRLPFDHRFHVDRATMKVPNTLIRAARASDAEGEGEGAARRAHGVEVSASTEGASSDTSEPEARPAQPPRPRTAGAAVRPASGAGAPRPSSALAGSRIFRSAAFAGTEVFVEAARRASSRPQTAGPAGRGGGAPTAITAVATSVATTSGAPRPTKDAPPSLRDIRLRYEAKNQLIAPRCTHPTCPRCYAQLRPRVLMFDDDRFVELPREEAKYEAFRGWLTSSRPQRVVLVEAGCGLRVPTLREEMELLLRKLTKRGVDCRLFRINHGSRHLERKTRPYADRVHHILLGGLAAMRSLEAAMASAEAGQGSGPGEGGEGAGGPQ